MALAGAGGPAPVNTTSPWPATRADHGPAVRCSAAPTVRQGNRVILDGTVSVPEVGAPVLLMTWAY